MTSNLKQLTGLWLKDGRSGKYMSGKFDGRACFIFKNIKKNSPNEPDYYLCQSPDANDPAWSTDGNERPDKADGIPY